MQNFKYKKVLIVDDSEIDNFIHKQLMVKTNFASETVEKLSGKSGIDYLKSLKSQDECPQIIFLDILMPIMDGFGFLTEFETLPDFIKSKSKIIMLSSSESFKDLNKANGNKHVSKFLNKPLSEKALEVINL